VLLLMSDSEFKQRMSAAEVEVGVVGVVDVGVDVVAGLEEGQVEDGEEDGGAKHVLMSMMQTVSLRLVKNLILSFAHGRLKRGA
jgi:hypothetical protein